MKHASEIQPANAEEERLRQFDLREIDAGDPRDHFALKYVGRVEAVVNAIRTRVEPPGRVLEVGCAQANISLLLAESGYRTVGLDLIVEALGYARKKRESGQFFPVCASADAVPVGEDSLDAVFVGELLEHCARPVEVLRGIVSCLRPGGIMVVTTPNGARWGQHPPTYRQVRAEEVEDREFGLGGEHHLFEFTMPELVAAVAEAGLEPLEATAHASILHTEGSRPVKGLLSPKTVRSLARVTNRIPYLGPRTALTLMVVAQKPERESYDAGARRGELADEVSTLVFADEHSSNEARELVEAEADRANIPMVLREADLRVLEYPGVGPHECAHVAEESEDLAAQVAAFLPGMMRTGKGDAPSLWDCYRESFRSWAVAPLVSNAMIARIAVGAHHPDAACVVENPRKGAWWAFRHQVHEAARAGLLGTGIEPLVTPAEPLRTLRTALTFLAPLRGIANAAGGGQARKRLAWMRSLPEPGPADVLFLAMGSTSVPIIDRIAPQLQEDKGLSAAALAFFIEDIGMERSARKGVPYQYIDNFHAPGTVGHGSWKPALGLLAMWPGWLLSLAVSGGEKQFGRLWPGIRNRLVSSLGRDAQQLLADIEAAGHILETYRPKCIVAFHLNWPRIAPVILMARARGIPVLYLQHGIYLAKDHCTTPLEFDEYMVFGQGAEDVISGRTGKLPISHVGHCLYDDSIAGGKPPLPDTDGERPRSVLIATQPHQEDIDATGTDRWWVRGVAEACRELGAKAIIKLHPREVAIDGYWELQKQMPDVVEVAPHGTRNLADLIAETDCLLTVDSTVVLEANLMGKPVVVVNLTGNRDRFPFVEDGGASGAYRYEDILPALRLVLETDGAQLAASRAGFLRRHLGFTDGRSTERVVEIIGRHAGKAER